MRYVLLFLVPSFLMGCETADKVREAAEEYYVKPGVKYCAEKDQAEQDRLRARSDEITDPHGFRYRVECER